MGKLAPLDKKVEQTKRLLPMFKHHPCDSCGMSKIDGQPIANAKYEITTASGSIYLCAHHFDKHKIHVLERAYEFKIHGEDGASA